MSASTMDLSLARTNLNDALPGDTVKVYLQILKSWFKSRITREDFDHEARKLFTEDTVHIHNQFILAIMTKCHSLGSSLVRDQSSSGQSSKSSPMKSKSKSKDSHKRPYPSSSSSAGSSRPHFQRFTPVNPLLHLPQVNVDVDEKGLGFASREMTLPDIGMVHGRMLVTAWDFGVENVDDTAVRALMSAVEAQLKNILMAVFMRRSAYKLREGKFRHALGTQLPQTQFRNSAHVRDDSQESEATSVSSKGLHIPAIKPSVETGLRDAALQLACAGDTPPTKYPVTLFDVFDALQVHKSVIPSHTVYATNMERIIHKLWHPSNEEVEQADIHRQEVALKRDIAYQQIALLRT